jgi:hypothetical protein
MSPNETKKRVNDDRSGLRKKKIQEGKVSNIVISPRTVQKKNLKKRLRTSKWSSQFQAIENALSPCFPTCQRFCLPTN